MIQLADLNGKNGFKIDGEEEAESHSGHVVSIIGDINSDGYADLLIGAPQYNNNMGRSYKASGKYLHESIQEEWKWKGKPIQLIDGTTVSMPDTPENQAAYPHILLKSDYWLGVK